MFTERMRKKSLFCFRILVIRNNAGTCKSLTPDLVLKDKIQVWLGSIMTTFLPLINLTYWRVLQYLGCSVIIPSVIDHIVNRFPSTSNYRNQ